MFSQAHDSPPIADSTNTCLLFIEEMSITVSARFLKNCFTTEDQKILVSSFYLSISHYLEV